MFSVSFFFLKNSVTQSVSLTIIGNNLLSYAQHLSRLVFFFLFHLVNWASDIVLCQDFKHGPFSFTSSLQYQFAKFKNDDYSKSGKGNLKLQLINQREDFSFALFSGGLRKVRLYTYTVFYLHNNTSGLIWKYTPHIPNTDERPLL